MRITVLGSAAGGGFPQWNCACRLCAGVRSGQVRATPRTQSSIFVQPSGTAGTPEVLLPDGLLVNASPDVLQQIKERAAALQPARAARDSAIAAVLLVDGQIDHTTGLLMLRERGRPLPVWCTDPVAEDLSTGHPVLRVLGHFCGVERHRIEPDGRPFAIDGLPGLELRAIALRSNAAPYSPHRDAPVAGDNVGLTFIDAAGGRRVFYAPGLGEIEPAVADAMHAADVVMVDGTFWRDDEMIALGMSKKTARSIGHLPQSGPGGMLDVLRELPRATRRILIHVNNTNPILDEDSPERARLASEGVEVAFDGMTIDV